MLSICTVKVSVIINLHPTFLQMGQLVFARLFYHHMAGQLAGQKDFKNRLFTYLDGE